MAGLLENLGDNHAILLMYLAQELPAQERAQVEQMLATDPSLRAELDELRATQDFVAHALQAAEVPPDARAEDAAVRRVVREMRRYQLELMARPAEPSIERRMWPRWVYPVGAAAALIFMMIGLWGAGIFDRIFDLQPQPNSTALSVSVASNEATDTVAILLEEKWLSDSDEPALDQATQHATELESAREEDPLLLMI
ncbi:MAG: anti-sigma factor family protein [Bacillota bacterium]